MHWQTPPPVAIGSRVEFVAQFLGRRLAYTYEEVELVPERRLVMRIADGPFQMETAYTWEPAGEGATRMTLRNRGNPSGFSRVAAPIMQCAMRRTTTRDLARLMALLEAGERVGKHDHVAALTRGAQEMDFTGRPMRGMVIVPGSQVVDEPALHEWVAIAVEFARSQPPKANKNT